MPRLTRKETRRLQSSANLVRMYVATLTFVFAVLCFPLANAHYRKIEAAGVPPEIPRAATYATIVGIYMPMFAAVAAYVWATRSAGPRNLAPHGFGMALFRDAFTLLVLTVLLGVPVYLYAIPGATLQWIESLLGWYQNILTAAAGAAFTYYFHASIVPADRAVEEQAAPARPAVQGGAAPH